MDATCANGDDSSDEDDDFIAVLESRLEGDVEVNNFALQFEEELEHKLASGGASLCSSSFLDVPPPFFDDNSVELYTIEEDDEENNYDDDRLPKHVRGNCIKGYAFGNLFDSCWYKKFLAPDRDGIEGSRRCTR